MKLKKLAVMFSPLFYGMFLLLLADALSYGTNFAEAIFLLFVVMVAFLLLLRDSVA